MKIVVCDDDALVYEQMKNIIASYSIVKNENLELTFYQTVEELLHAKHIPMSELFPQGEGPKAKEIGIIDDAQLQEIISLWHKIPGEARGSAYVMIKGMLIAAQQLPQK